MRYDNSQPIWLQVARDVKGRIVAGDIAPGERLPSVQEMALRYAINPNTAQRVYRTLEEEGAITIRRGVGAFAPEDASVRERMRDAMVAELVGSFLTGMKALGCDRKTCVSILEGDRTNADI